MTLLEQDRGLEQLSKLDCRQYELVLTFQEEAHLPYYSGSVLRGSFGHAFMRVACPFSKSLKRTSNREPGRDDPGPASRHSQASEQPGVRETSAELTGFRQPQRKAPEVHQCPLGERCLYLQVFETPPPKDSEMMRKYTSAPHPFVLEPLNASLLQPSNGCGQQNWKRTYKPGEEFRFGLTLIGKATQYLPYFVYAFHEHGKVGMGNPRARYQLKKIYSLPINGPNADQQSGEKIEIFDASEGVLKTERCETTGTSFMPARYWNEAGATSPHPPTSGLATLTLNFLTPTRLKYEEHLAPRPEFHILIRNLQRRLSLLSYFHAGFKLDLPFTELIEEARKVKIKQMKITWVDWERYSSRQDTRMTLGGFVGAVTYEGNLSPFLHYLQVGQSVHVGKGTTFGLGKYEILMGKE